MTDSLREATQALREFGKTGTDASPATRARVLTSLQRTKGTSRRRSFVAIPLAALLIGSLAVAATGGQIPAPVQKWFSALTAHEPSKPAVHRQHSRQLAPAKAPPPRADSGEVPVLATSELQPDEQPLTQRGDAKLSAERAVDGAPGSMRHASTERATPDEKPMSEEEYERYRTAHEAHFIKKDPAAALAAWSEYLAYSPTGRLAVEARYNRALCLLKLGRDQEAMTALRPFTRGSYGAYRQKEAQRLIAQLEHDAGAVHLREGGN
jgi:hypothetical protein